MPLRKPSPSEAAAAKSSSLPLARLAPPAVDDSTAIFFCDTTNSRPTDDDKSGLANGNSSANPQVPIPCLLRLQGKIGSGLGFHSRFTM
jgi:hypothetical protein